jgi:hypothetical protein
MKRDQNKDELEPLISDEKAKPVVADNRLVAIIAVNIEVLFATGSQVCYKMASANEVVLVDY